MTVRIREISRHPTTGAEVSGVTVAIKKHVDDSTVDSTASSGAGISEFTQADIGYPGPVYATQTSSGTTTERSGKIAGQIAGLIWENDLPDVIAAHGEGVAQNGNRLAVSADGSGMHVNVATGLLIHKDGFPFVVESTTQVAIAAADPTNPRIDRVIVRLTREGQTEQGKMELTTLTGTPAGSPAAPALTQTASTWEVSLAQVNVLAAVSVIAADKVTDERTLLQVVPSGGTSSQVLVGGTVPSWTTVPTAALPSGIDASKIGSGGVSTAEYDYLANVTSDIQTQLNAKANDTGDTFTGPVVIAKTSTDALNIATDSSGTTYVSVDTSGGNFDIQEGMDFKIWAGPGFTNNKFTVDGATGNTTVGGTLAVTGNLTASNKAATFTQYGGFTVMLGNAVDVLTSGEPALTIEVPESCTLVRVSVESTSGGSGNLRINFAKAAAGSTSYSNIDATDPLGLSAATLSDKTSFTGWTTAWTALDKIRISVDGAVTPTNITQARVSVRWSITRGA